MTFGVLCLSSPGQERLQLNAENSLHVTSMGGCCRKDIEFVAVVKVQPLEETAKGRFHCCLQLHVEM